MGNVRDEGSKTWEMQDEGKQELGITGVSDPPTLEGWDGVAVGTQGCSGWDGVRKLQARRTLRTR